MRLISRLGDPRLGVNARCSHWTISTDPWLQILRRDGGGARRREAGALGGTRAVGRELLGRGEGSWGGGLVYKRALQRSKRMQVTEEASKISNSTISSQDVHYALRHLHDISPNGHTVRSYSYLTPPPTTLAYLTVSHRPLDKPPPPLLPPPTSLILPIDPLDMVITGHHLHIRNLRT